MAGGIFQSQNKVRAGAYINFESVPKPMSKVGTRGIATIPIPLTWGATLTELYSTDLIDGSSLAKVIPSLLKTSSAKKSRNRGKYKIYH